MLGKILIFALIGVVIYFMLKSKLNSKIKDKQNDDKNDISELVECKKCNCFVDIKELQNGICKNCLKSN